MDSIAQRERLSHLVDQGASRAAITETRRDLADAEGFEKLSSQAREALAGLETKIDAVVSTGEPLAVYTIFSRSNALTLEQVLNDPLAQEIWDRLSASELVTPDLRTRTVWSDSPEYPVCNLTGPDRNFENTYVLLTSIFIQPK